MKKINVLLFVLILYCQAIHCQQFLIDSLQKILPTTVDPVQKIDLLLGLTRANIFVNGQAEANVYVTQAMELAKKQNDKAGIAMAMLFMEQVEVLGARTTAIDYPGEALKMARSISSKSVEAFAAYHVAEQYIYERNDYKTGLEILHKALKKTDKSVPDKHIGNIHKVMARAYSLIGESTKTIDHFQKALYYFNRLKTHPFVDPALGRPSYMDADGGELNKSQVLIYLSREFYKKGDHQEALHLLKEALALSKKYNLGGNEAWALEEMAINYIAMGTFDRAIENYQRAIGLYEKDKSLYYLAPTLQELGSLFYRMKDWAVADSYFKKALAINRSLPDTLGMMSNYSRMGQVAIAQDQPKKAIMLYVQAALLNAKLKDSTTLSTVYADMATAWKNLKNFPQGLHYYQKALQLNRRFNNQILALGNLIGISTIYVEQAQPDSAQYYAELALAQSKKYGSLEQQKAIQYLLSQINEQQGDYQTALQYHKNYQQLNDSIYTANAQLKLKEAQVRQNVADYQKEKEQAKRETALLNTRNRLYLALVFAFLSIILLGGFLFFQLRKARNQLKAQNLQLQQLNATKDKFFGIIAHDIRSPIVALEGVGEQMTYYLEKQQPDKLARLASRVEKTAQQLGTLLDNLLNWALLQQGVIPYRPKPIQVKQVMAELLEIFQANAQAKNIQLESNIPEDLVAYADENTFQAILRNLVSNAIKFTPSGGKVAVTTEIKERKVFININDTGTGISVEKLAKLFVIDKSSEKGTAGEKGTGLGLILVKELVELNKGNVQVESVINLGSRFTVSLPMSA